MIKTFIFVEDGSVDLDELKSSVGDDVLVISYRQGAASPEIRQPREPVSRREVNIKDCLLGLLIEFDEMGFLPTTVCEEPEGYAIKWKELLLEEIKALESDNVSLRNEADENAALSMESKMRADRLEVENAALRERLEKAVELPCVKKSTKWAWSLATGDSVLVENYLLLYKDNEGYVHYEEIDDNEEALARLAELNGGKG